MKSFFTPKEVFRLIGISYRQIQYWDSHNFIKPSYRRRGKYRLYTFSDLIQIRLVKLLREHGMSIQKLRRTVLSLKKTLVEIHYPLAVVTFLIEGDRILVFEGDVIMNEACANCYVKFEVKTLVDEINKVFPDVVLA